MIANLKTILTRSFFATIGFVNCNLTFQIGVISNFDFVICEWFHCVYSLPPENYFDFPVCF